MKTSRFVLIWIVILALGFVLQSPKPAAGQITNPSDRRLLKPIPPAENLSATSVLEFRLPYDSHRVIEWRSGPHQFANTDGFASIPVGQGSGMDFAAPLNDPNPNFDVANMAAGTVLQVNSLTSQGQCIDSPGKAGYGCWVAVQESTHATVMIYAHLRPNTIAVIAGDAVFQGQFLAQAGQSGGQATIHLHLDLRDAVDFDCPILDNTCNWGSPLGWANYPLILDNYSINGFFTQGSNKTSIRNYDGSALYDPAHESSKLEIADFPYIDWGGAVFSVSNRVQAIAAVSPAFVCEPKNLTCDTNSDQRTQFAGKGRVNGIQSERSFHEPGVGYLISSNILVKLPHADPISGIDFCGGTDFGYPCVNYTWTNNDTCINLGVDQMAKRVNSLRFNGDYAQDFEAVLYAGPSCQTPGTSYTLDATTLGLLNNTVGLVKIKKHILYTSGTVDLYPDSNYVGAVSSIQYSGDADCYDLTPLGINHQANSLRFRSGYINEFNAFFYTDPACTVLGAEYGQDVANFGKDLNDKFSSVRLVYHGPVMPDLVPYPATGIGDPVVIAMQERSTENTILISGQNAWVSWGGKNIGSAAAGDHFIYLLLDGLQKVKYPLPSLPSNTWEGFKVWILGNDIPPGWHRIDLIVDATHVLGETNMNNNTWTGMFFWQPPAVIFLPTLSR